MSRRSPSPPWMTRAMSGTTDHRCVDGSRCSVGAIARSRRLSGQTVSPYDTPRPQISTVRTASVRACRSREPEVAASRQIVSSRLACANQKSTSTGLFLRIGQSSSRTKRWARYACALSSSRSSNAWLKSRDLTPGAHSRRRHVRANITRSKDASPTRAFRRLRSAQSAIACVRCVPEGIHAGSSRSRR